MTKRVSNPQAALNIALAQGGNNSNLVPAKSSEIDNYRNHANQSLGGCMVPAQILHGEFIPAHEIGQIARMPAKM